MKTFKFYNRLLGWVVFLIAAFVYISTAEPTASLWDCGEFIASAFKLQVGHPPGAPFFMILARVFTLFAGNNLENVAFMVNVLSALASAFTIMFLFWSITHLARKFVKTESIEGYQLVGILGSGLVGALAYTFSDTFWFSAVEGEVYALSSLFTAIVFWAILKWENIADEPFANRWLILIAYLMGLSIGVHLLNLLAIPALALVYYFKKYEVTQSGLIKAIIVAALLLGGVMYGIIPGVIWLATKFELIFTNGFGFPYNTGVIVYAVLLLGGLTYGIYYTHQKGKVLANTILLAVGVIIIGYSSYSMIVIRSLANPPMDENSPETVFLLQKYLNREQYGDRPLAYGQSFNSPLVGTKESKPNYRRKNGKYVNTHYKLKYEFAPEYNMLFPRMYSFDNEHINEYLKWGKIDEKDVFQARRDANGQIVYNRNGQIAYDRNNPREKPSFGQNMRFFFSYQVFNMYNRYFFWNFAGRQNNEQNFGGTLNGNWITGIKGVDKILVGEGDKLPDVMKNDPSRNTYFLLPLLFGLFGMIYHFKRNSKDFWVVLTLFVLTGLAIVIYLNQTPLQPRERDYAYAGSFYAFAIWIGLAIYGIIDLAGKALKNVPAAGALTLAGLLLVPGIMAKENWDDHDRSGRYTTRDIAYNYLNSCAPNAILFTNGDNDTFPLWYIQEVEGVRTDVRVVNLMLLNMDWYIDAMNRKAYDSDRLPITLHRDQYLDGTRDVVYVQERFKQAYDARDVIQFIADNTDASRLRTNDGRMIDYVPTRKFFLTVDSSKVIANGTIKPYEANQLVDKVEGTINGSRLSKSDLIALDIIANNNWERPIYFVSTAHDAIFGLEDYLQLDGFAYRLVPIKSETNGYETGRINTEILYDNLMNKFKFGRMNEDDIFLDNFHQRTLSIVRLRYRFNRLARKLMDEGRNEEAIKVLDRIMDEMPRKNVPYGMFMPAIADTYYALGEKEKAHDILQVLYKESNDRIVYYKSLRPAVQEAINSEIVYQLRIIANVAQLANQYDDAELAAQANASLDENRSSFGFRY